MPRTAYWWYRSERYGLVDRSRSNQLRAASERGERLIEWQVGLRQAGRRSS